MDEEILPETLHKGHALHPHPLENRRNRVLHLADRRWSTRTGWRFRDRCETGIPVNSRDRTPSASHYSVMEKVGLRIPAELLRAIECARQTRPSRPSFLALDTCRNASSMLGEPLIDFPAARDIPHHSLTQLGRWVELHAVLPLVMVGGPPRSFRV